MTTARKKLRILTRNSGEWCSKKCPGLTEKHYCKHFNRALNLVMSDFDQDAFCWHIRATRCCVECIEYREKKR